MSERILSTEGINPLSKGIDTKSTIEICKIMNHEDMNVPLAIEKSLDKIASLIDTIVIAFKNGGRLVYIGAGTSGRLGVLDASECPPTFGVSNEMVVGIIAGGDRALRNAIERAEDDENAGIEDLKRINFSSKDVLVGLSASGSAPYVCSALAYAKSIGAKTGSISCNIGAKASEIVDHAIELDVGPEIISGSTRLKSGTAEKLVLNMLTTISMIRIGLVYDNLMVNLMPTNKKLEKRAKGLIVKIANCDEEKAEECWNRSEKNVPIAILIALYDLKREEASAVLKKADNNLHVAMELCEELAHCK